MLVEITTSIQRITREKCIGIHNIQIITFTVVVFFHLCGSEPVIRYTLPFMAKVV